MVEIKLKMLDSKITALYEFIKELEDLKTKLTFVEANDTIETLISKIKEEISAAKNELNILVQQIYEEAEEIFKF